MNTLSECPFCKKEIDPMQFSWDCPVCGHHNKDSNIFENCEFCRFAPRLMKCPNCSKWFETWHLIGTFEGTYMRIFRPEDFPHKVTLTINLQQIRKANTGDITLESLKRIDPLKFDSIFSQEFSFPEDVKCIILHTLHENPKDTFWLHCWLFKSENPNIEKEEPTGQVSFRYPSASGGKIVDVKVLDVQMH